MSTSTSYYNVYRVTFIQIDDPKHVAIALVPGSSSDQGTGELIHLVGFPNMYYERKRHYDFGNKRTFKCAEFMYKIAARDADHFVRNAEDTTLPKDPRDHLELEDRGPIRTPIEWVDAVLKIGEAFAY
ncbi:Mitochondrial oxaloacetate carrier protein [Ascosphaera pollenicola]|nr:Mitochondrial oxaloacetate carrier protein [Ascosphaera pollenicola]